MVCQVQRVCMENSSPLVMEPYFGWSGSETHNRIRTQLYECREIVEIRWIASLISVFWLWVWWDMASSSTVETVAEKSFDINKTTVKICQSKKPVNKLLLVIGQA